MFKANLIIMYISFYILTVVFKENLGLPDLLSLLDNLRPGHGVLNPLQVLNQLIGKHSIDLDKNQNINFVSDRAVWNRLLILYLFSICFLDLWITTDFPPQEQGIFTTMRRKEERRRDKTILPFPPNLEIRQCPVSIPGEEESKGAEKQGVLF